LVTNSYSKINLSESAWGGFRTEKVCFMYLTETVRLISIY